MTLLDKINAAKEKKREERLRNEEATYAFGASLSDELSPDYSVWYMALGESDTGEPSAVYAVVSPKGCHRDDDICFVARVVVSEYLVSQDGLAVVFREKPREVSLRRGEVVRIYVRDRFPKNGTPYRQVPAKTIDFNREELIPYLT